MEAYSLPIDTSDSFKSPLITSTVELKTRETDRAAAQGAGRNDRQDSKDNTTVVKPKQSKSRNGESAVSNFFPSANDQQAALLAKPND